MITPEVASGVFAFTWLALAMTLAPGSDTVFVVRSSLAAGWKAGVVAALGIVCGVVLWGGLAGLGVALLLVRWPVVYNLVAVAGGVYLGYLAVQTFLGAWKTWGAAVSQEGEAESARPLGQVFRAGFLTNLLNPKIGVFYLSVMPGLFLGQGLTVWLGLLLGGIHAAWGVLWLSIVSLVAGWARKTLLRPRARAVLDAICGVLLLGFGIFVIVEVATHLK